MHICSRALKTGQQRVLSIIVTAMKDTSLLCNPVLHAMVIVAKLDSSFSLGIPGHSRETPSAAWEACVSRLPGEDALTLANRVFDSYLQKLGDDIDHHTIWSNEQYARRSTPAPLTVLETTLVTPPEAALTITSLPFVGTRHNRGFAPEAVRCRR